jgi:hypothetical protein
VIRAPHQDEPRIGLCRWGGWVARAFALRHTTTPMLPFERKASPSCIGRAIVANGRINCFVRLAVNRLQSLTPPFSAVGEWG